MGLFIAWNKKLVATILAFSWCLGLFLSLVHPISAQQGNPNPGAIWTTNDNCSDVNENHFARKEDVYLNGGPSNRNNPGLSDGNYYVKVTEPQGNMLGITNGPAAVVANGRFIQCYNVFLLTNFADTANSGGEYKIWISQNIDFDNSDSKTDNFQVDSQDPTVTPEPTSTPIPTETPGPSIEPSPTPSPTPMPTVAPTPTSTPNNSGTGGGQILAQAASTSVPAVSGQVLGASTLANTGDAIDNIFTLGFIVGIVSLLLGVKRYGKSQIS